MQDLITGQAGAVAAIPDYAKGDSGLGDLGGESFPRLTFKGNRFRVTKGGDEEVLDDVTLDVIILAANPTVSRVYYSGAYDAESGTGERPMCASTDGEVPLPSVAAPQSATCMTCPQNEKGSAISADGGKRKACGYFHRLVVKLVKYPDLGDVVAEIKAMSLFGESYPDKNLLNFRHYADRLNQHQTMAHAVITQMSFDTNSSVPKILFQPIGYVPEELFKTVIHPLATSAETLQLADTSSMRTGNTDDAPPAPDGFRDKLMAEAPPAHAQLAAPAQPALSPQEQQLADLQAQIAALEGAAAQPEPEPAPPPPPPEPELTPEQQKIKDLQAQIAGLQTPAPVIAPAVAPAPAVEPAPAQPASNVNQHGVTWNPELHATSSSTGAGILNKDGHWRARKGITPELVAQGKVPNAPVVPAATPEAPAAAATPEPVPPVESTEFDKGLDAALAEFDT